MIPMAIITLLSFFFMVRSFESSNKSKQEPEEKDNKSKGVISKEFAENDTARVEKIEKETSDLVIKILSEEREKIVKILQNQNNENKLECNNPS